MVPAHNGTGKLEHVSGVCLVHFFLKPQWNRQVRAHFGCVLDSFLLKPQWNRQAGACFRCMQHCVMYCDGCGLCERFNTQALTLTCKRVTQH